MSGISHILEDYSDGVGGISSLTEVNIEEQKLDSFEKGYAAGWEDSAKAQQDGTSQITTEFASNLQDLSFTYHEAQTHLIKTLTPLFQQLADHVFPQVAKESLGARVVEQLKEMAERQIDQKVEIVVADANYDKMESLISQDINMPITVVQEPSLGDGQVFLRLGAEEREINFDAMLDGVRSAISGFIHENEKDIANG